MIKREDLKEVTEKSRRHLNHKRMLAKIRKISKEIVILLEQVREKTTQEYR